MSISSHNSSPTLSTDPARKRYKHVSREDCYRRISWVSGKVVEAKNLVNTDTWGKSDPYCVVKGIRSNNHLVQIHTTRRIDNNLHPQWNEEFKFECPLSWGLNQLVGLKFFIYDSDDRVVSEIGSDDFLGGADLDLYDAPSNRLVPHTLELGGVELSKASANASVVVKKRSLLVVEIRINHELVPKPSLPEEALLDSLAKFTRITELECRIARARHLRNADAIGKSDPMCIVRAVTLSGRVDELHRTRVINNTLHPEWEETFTYRAPESDRAEDEAILLIFDVYDSDGGDDSKIERDGDHLGSGMICLMEFPTGERIRKRLELQGCSQLLETLLTREGVPTEENKGTLWSYDSSEENHGDGVMPARRAEDTAKKCGDFLANMIIRMKNIKLTGNSRSALLFEMTVQRVVDKMPHAALILNPIEVREEEDVYDIMALPDWGRSIFAVPSQLQKDSEREGRPQLATLKAKDKIVFISGMVHGATGLVSTDLFGKSDPYCIVEGVTLSGQVHFIHRTRVMQNKLCPEWQESFFYVVPDRTVVQRLNFLVFDSDESVLDGADILAGGGSSDDFLGRMSVDLSTLLTGDSICEDIPLTGCKAARSQQPKGSSTTAFRRSATISVQVRVERRAWPVYDIRREQLDWTPPLKHAVTRQPAIHRVYKDPSQNDWALELHEHLAAKVVHYADSKQLGQLARERIDDGVWRRHLDRGAWRHLAGEGRPRVRYKDPNQEVQDEEEELDPEVQEAIARKLRDRAAEETRDLNELAEVRRSGAPSEGRSASLPALHSRFGNKSGPHARQFARLRPHWVDTMGFRDGLEAGSRGLMRSMGLKPSLGLTRVGNR